MKFLVVFEKTKTGYSAFIPDMPGCVATGKSLAETQQLIQEGAEFHFQAMARDGEVLPEPSEVIPIEVPQASVGVIEIGGVVPPEWEERKA